MKRAGTALVLAVAAIAAAVPTATGQDHTLSIGANPENVKFGQQTTIAGQLTGPGAAGERVDLQVNPAGGNNNFQNIANTTTSSIGIYSFTTAPPINGVYRARARTNPRTDSGQIFVGVIPRLSFGVTDSTPEAGDRVGFYGAVRPEHDGSQVNIQRHTSSGWRTVRTAILQDAPAGQARSVWLIVLRVNHDGTYRAILPLHEDHKTGKSRSRRINAH